MIDLSQYPKFARDVDSPHTNIYPIVFINYSGLNTNKHIAISTIEESFKDKEDDGTLIHFNDYGLVLSNIKESINIPKRQFKVNNVTVSFNNYPIDGNRFSDSIFNYIGLNVDIYYKSQSCNTLEDCLHVYTGNIKDIKYNDKLIKLTLEDQTSSAIHKVVPIANLGHGDNIFSKDYIDRYIPICYGKVDKAPSVLYQQASQNNQRIYFITDNVFGLNNDPVEIEGFNSDTYTLEDNIYIEQTGVPVDQLGNKSHLWIHKGDYYNVLQEGNADISSKYGYESSTQIIIDPNEVSPQFLSMEKDFEIDFPLNPPALSQLQCIKVTLPNKVNLLTNPDGEAEEDDADPPNQVFLVDSTILDIQGCIDDENTYHDFLVDDSNWMDTQTSLPNTEFLSEDYNVDGVLLDSIAPYEWSYRGIFMPKDLMLQPAMTQTSLHFRVQQDLLVRMHEFDFSHFIITPELDEIIARLDYLVQGVSGTPQNDEDEFYGDIIKRENNSHYYCQQHQITEKLFLEYFNSHNVDIANYGMAFNNPETAYYMHYGTNSATFLDYMYLGMNDVKNGVDYWWNVYNNFPNNLSREAFTKTLTLPSPVYRFECVDDPEVNPLGLEYILVGQKASLSLSGTTDWDTVSDSGNPILFVNLFYEEENPDVPFLYSNIGFNPSFPYGEEDESSHSIPVFRPGNKIDLSWHNTTGNSQYVGQARIIYRPMWNEIEFPSSLLAVDNSVSIAYFNEGCPDNYNWSGNYYSYDAYHNRQYGSWAQNPTYHSAPFWSWVDELDTMIGFNNANGFPYGELHSSLSGNGWGHTHDQLRNRCKFTTYEDIPGGHLLQEPALEYQMGTGSYDNCTDNDIGIKKNTLMSTLGRYQEIGDQPITGTYWQIGAQSSQDADTISVSSGNSTSRNFGDSIMLTFSLDNMSVQDAVDCTTYPFGKIETFFWPEGLPEDGTAPPDDNCRFNVYFSATYIPEDEDGLSIGVMDFALDSDFSTNLFTSDSDGGLIDDGIIVDNENVNNEISWSTFNEDFNSEDEDNNADYGSAYNLIPEWDTPDVFNSFSLSFALRNFTEAIDGYDRAVQFRTNIKTIGIFQFILFENVFESDFYIDTFGRFDSEGLYGGGLIEKSADIIYHFIENELNAKDIVDIDNWQQVRDSSFKMAFSITDEMDSKKLLQEMCLNSNLITRFNSKNKFSFIEIKHEYSLDSTSLIKEEDVIKFLLTATPLKEIYTIVNVKYKKDYAEDEFFRQTGYCDAYDFYGNGDGYITEDFVINGNNLTFSDGQGGTPGGYRYSLYGLEREDNILEFKSDYIRDPIEAKKLRDFIFLLHCNRHAIAKLTLPLKYSYLEPGDIIRFDKIINNLKSFGEDYTQFNTRNGQQIYPYFMVTSTTKSAKDIKIECTQLHKLTPSVEQIQPGSLTRMHWTKTNGITMGNLNYKDWGILSEHLDGDYKYITSIQKSVSDLSGAHKSINDADLLALATLLGIEEPELVPFDVSGDGVVNIVDVVFLINYILQIGDLSEEQIALADSNSDGIVDVIDVINLLDEILYDGV